MSHNAPLRAVSPLLTADAKVPRHCSEAEYVAFTANLPLTEPARRKHANFHRRFVRTYPDLDTWFTQPLRVRLGWRNGEGQNRRCAPKPGFDPTTAWINFNARHYLTYLALTGRLRMDWGWLLGIGVLKPFLIADLLGLPLRDQSEDLRERLLALGHVRDNESFKVPWGLIRLVMHRGDPDLHTLTSDDIEAMRHAIRHCERVPGLLQIIGEDRIPALKLSWGTNTYRTGLALFHAGITGRPPAGKRPSRHHVSAANRASTPSSNVSWPNAPWSCDPRACPVPAADYAASDSGWTPNAPASTASTSSTGPIWSTSWNRCTGCTN
ncbi:hypothetical protein AB0F07_33265 [Streptomyces fructofermentans]|uniref:hypothetical protein n=1 Tax=Streptomyces fructofermentans TaxID=152141 RepID=UPI00340B8BF0